MRVFRLCTLCSSVAIWGFLYLLLDDLIIWQFGFRGFTLLIVRYETTIRRHWSLRSAGLKPKDNNGKERFFSTST